jgi:N-acetylmuramoyl-L-alanine amidase
MPKIHRVKQGETLSGIARDYGFSKWEKLWAENVALRRKRKSPHLLYPGDEIEIPTPIARHQSAATGRRHRFKLTANVLELELVLQDLAGEPLADLPYKLLVAGRTYTGTTSGEGVLTHPVPPRETTATLILSLGDRAEGKANELSVELWIGSLDPHDTISGIQARLNNLGYDSGTVDGIVGPATTAALRAFQERHGVAVSGKPDDATKAKLEQAHGC